MSLPQLELAAVGGDHGGAEAVGAPLLDDELAIGADQVSRLCRIVLRSEGQLEVEFV